MRTIRREECDTVDEVCKLFQQVYCELELMNAKICQLEKKKEKKKKEDGRIGVLMLILMFILSLGLAFSEPQRLNYDTVSNPETLERYLRNPLITTDKEYGVSGTGVDVKFWGDTDGDYMLWDQSADALVFVDTDIKFGDSDGVYFGDGTDAQITFDGTNFEFYCAAADTPLVFGDATVGFDVTYYFETAGTIDIDYDGDNMTFSDDMQLIFGTDSDVSIQYDENGDNDLQITGDISVEGTTPIISMGDAGEEDTQINFDGNAQDYAIGLDDTADDLLIQNGTTLNDSTAAININSSQVVTFSQPIVMNGGQTRKVLFSPDDVTIDGTAGPAAAVIGTSAQSQQDTLQFDADGGSTGDDYAFVVWHVPDGYVVDSARLNVCYTFSTAEDAADEAQFDFTVNAVAPGEVLDAAGTALADQTTVIADASADNGKLHVTQYNIEVEDIAIDDIVVINVAVDESASALANSGTLDVLYFEIEYESTE